MLNLFQHQDSRPSLPLCPDIIPSISVRTQISLVSIAILWEEKSRYLMYKMPSCIDSWEGLALEHKTRLSQASLTLPLTFGDLSILCHSFVVACHFSVPGGCGWAKEMVISSFHGLFNPFSFPPSFILCLLLFFTKGLLLNWKGNWQMFPQIVSMQ